jgi:hypothetical protein
MRLDTLLLLILPVVTLGWFLLYRVPALWGLMQAPGRPDRRQRTRASTVIVEE